MIQVGSLVLARGKYIGIVCNIANAVPGDGIWTAYDVYFSTLREPKLIRCYNYELRVLSDP